MSDFMKIGGKYTDSLSTETAVGVAVDAAGRVEVVRHNETEKVTICASEQKRDTTNIVFTGDSAIDLSEWTTCCLLVANSLDVPVTLQFFTQREKSGSAYLKNADGSNVTYTLINGTGGYMVTPDDLPILNYLRYFKGQLMFSTAPTSGSLSLEVLLKR